MAKAEKVKVEDVDTTHDTAPVDSQKWVTIKTDRPVYKSERGKGGVLQGVVLGLVDMPPANGRAWKAFIIRVTAPVQAKSRDGKIVTVTPDSENNEVLVAANHQLLQHLGRPAMHPRFTYEVKITPSGSIKTGSGEMTNFDLKVNPNPFLRTGQERMLAMQSAPALPAAQEATVDDNIPF